VEQQPVILFDGICNFCNSSVNFIIKRNRKKDIRFAALQSDAGRQLLSQYQLPVREMESIVFIENGKAYVRSTAALRISRHLNAAWPLCYGFIIIPRFIRDAVYNWIAANRYKWFGVQEQCMLPTPDVRERFLN